MNKLYRNKRNANGFTLIELLLVITIIGVLAAVVVPRFFGRSQEARIIAARQTIIGTFGIAMDLFEQDTGQYPTDEGLQSLITNPGVRNWRGPYLKSASVPRDPWGNEYHYQYPSQLTSSEFLYDIISPGPDGVIGNEDDITNHDELINERLQ
ncbi:type II secretion system major pseudopilin GspG [Planctomycetota bacterium]